MKVQPLPAEQIRIPPPWVLQRHLKLAGRLGGATRGNVVTSREITRAAPTRTAGKQLAHLLVKHRLALRIRHGEYGLVDPGVAIRSWAVPNYYAQLLTVTDALTRAGIAHAFACMTAGIHADYVPERPLLVIRTRDDAPNRIEHFAYDYPLSSLTHARIEALGESFSIPTLSKEQAAIVLASTSLPREVRAAKQLLARRRLTKRLAMQLNSLGVRTDESVHESESPSITLPAFIETRRRRLADESLRESLR